MLDFHYNVIHLQPYESVYLPENKDDVSLSYYKELKNFRVSLKDFIIITCEDVARFMEIPEYEYCASVFKGGIKQDEVVDFNEGIDARGLILELAKKYSINQEHVFEYQEGDCGESATVYY